MPYIYRILRDRAHIKSHDNYLKRLTFFNKNSKIFLLLQEQEEQEGGRTLRRAADN